MAEPRRYPLVGGSYAAISPAAAATTCVNLIPERFADPSERAKGGGMLIGTPGKHLFKDLTVIDAGATPFRGFLHINGRTWVVAGTKFFEISSTGALVGSIQTVTYDAANPIAQLFSNGNGMQIMIVSANVCHVWDGFTMNVIDVATFSGTCNTAGLSLFWVSGGKFEAAMAGQPVIVHGIGFTVSSVNSPDYITLTATAAKSITAATTNTSCRLTFSATHGFSDGDEITVSGATLTWLPLNGTWQVQVVTVLDVVIDLDSSTFGALTGTVISDFYHAPFQSNPAPMLSSTGTVIDGYFVVSRAVSSAFNVSPLLDGGNNGTWIWDQLDRAFKESTPGNLRSVLAANEKLFLWGIDGFEVWANTGQGIGGFPFERIDGATSNVGSISRWGPIDIGGRVCFVGGVRGQIVAYMLDGYTPRPVSTYAEEAVWNAASLGVDCISSAYLEEGHIFWEIDFGTQTWVYDLGEKLWHTRQSWNGSVFGSYGRKYKVFAQNAQGSANDWGAGGKHLCGGDGTGKVYEEKLTFYDDMGADMKWQRCLPYQYEQGKRIYFGRQTLEYETGTVPSGAEPVISRDYSDDRGATFSTPQTAGIGTAGQTGKRVYWPTGGSSYNRLWRYSGVGQNKMAAVCLDSEQEAGAV